MNLIEDSIKMTKKTSLSYNEQIFALVYKQWVDVDKTPVLALDVFNMMIQLLKLSDVPLDDSKKAWIYFILQKNKIPTEYYEGFLNTLNPETCVVVKETTMKSLKWLKEQPIHKQRSEEWFRFRNLGVTASAAYKILAGSKCDYDSLLNEKVVASSDFKVLTGKACMHGITYEQVAQYIYEKKFKVKIDEY